MVRGLAGTFSFMGLYHFSLGGIQLLNMAIDSQWITKFSDTNLIEIEESTPLLENRHSQKAFFVFIF